jgi:hypothetical protein
MDYTREITLESVPIANPDCVFREDASGWTALVNLDNASGIALNETGLLVWNTVDGQRTAARIIEEVKNHFTDAPASVGEDVLAILQTLLDAGLLGFEVKV